MANSDKGMGSMSKSKQKNIASQGGKSQGKENNPGNFANRSEKDVRSAAEKGGENSH